MENITAAVFTGFGVSFRVLEIFTAQDFMLQSFDSRTREVPADPTRPCDSALASAHSELQADPSLAWFVPLPRSLSTGNFTHTWKKGRWSFLWSQVADWCRCSQRHGRVQVSPQTNPHTCHQLLHVSFPPFVQLRLRFLSSTCIEYPRTRRQLLCATHCCPAGQVLVVAVF